MKNKEKDLKLLKMAAEKLPTTFQDGNVSQTVHGSDLLLKGVAKLADGTPVEKNKVYLQKTNDREMMPVNHFRRMKRLYLKNGIKAVYQYVDQVMTLHEEAKNNAVIY